MFPVVVGVSHSHQITDATSTTVALPDGCNVGGRLLIIVASKDGTGSFTVPLTPSLPQLFNINTGGSRFAAHYSILTGAEGIAGTGATISYTHASEEAAISAILIRDWHGTTIPEAANTGAIASGEPDPPVLTPSWGEADTLWITAFGRDGETSVVGFPTDFADNQHGDNTAGATGCVHGFSTRLLRASTLNPAAFDVSSTADDYCAATFAVRPADMHANPAADLDFAVL